MAGHGDMCGLHQSKGGDHAASTFRTQLVETYRNEMEDVQSLLEVRSTDLDVSVEREGVLS